jgi:hypothetical protein
MNRMGYVSEGDTEKLIQLPLAEVIAFFREHDDIFYCYDLGKFAIKDETNYDVQESNVKFVQDYTQDISTPTQFFTGDWSSLTKNLTGNVKPIDYTPNIIQFKNDVFMEEGNRVASGEYHESICKKINFNLIKKDKLKLNMIENSKFYRYIYSATKDPEYTIKCLQWLLFSTNREIGEFVIVFTGEANSGKSTMSLLLSELVSTKAATQIEIEKQNIGFLADAIGKDILIISELLDKKSPMTIVTLKQISGGDALPINQKFGDIITMDHTNSPKCLINSQIFFKDELDDGVKRRLCFCEFTKIEDFFMIDPIEEIISDGVELDHILSKWYYDYYDLKLKSNYESVVLSSSYEGYDKITEPMEYLMSKYFVYDPNSVLANSGIKLTNEHFTYIFTEMAKEEAISIATPKRYHSLVKKVFNQDLIGKNQMATNRITTRCYTGNMKGKRYFDMVDFNYDSFKEKNIDPIKEFKNNGVE